MARALLAPALAAASLGFALPARAADPPAGAPAGQPPPASQPPLQGDEATLRTGEPPTRLERVESENRPPSSVRFQTLLGGFAVGAGWWGLGAVSAMAFPDDPGMNDLNTPVVGPWLAIANNRCGGSCSLGAIARYVWFGLNGVGQVGGIGLMLESVLMRTGSAEAAPPSGPLTPRPSLVPPADSSPPPDPSKPLFFLPLPTVVGRDGVGVGWGGVF
ncbi:MAG TPA: hypothetical protein VFS43_44000 [Polyangiaceae bacterium]|nr:hypothetical protein [Polyangiaceae bacterium]